MILDDIWKIYQQEIFPVLSRPGLFNQYLDDDSVLDVPVGHMIRRDNLKNYLASFKNRPKIVLVGEAAGPWGCRFSGVPFTSERQLVRGELPFKGRRSGTGEVPVVEMSGSIVWRTIRDRRLQPLFLNSIPFHPHNLGQPLSIRKPRSNEVLEFSGLLEKFIEALTPKTLIAVGRSAEFALLAIGARPLYVRHPAHGGAPAFSEAMSKLIK